MEGDGEEEDEKSFKYLALHVLEDGAEAADGASKVAELRVLDVLVGGELGVGRSVLTDEVGDEVVVLLGVVLDGLDTDFGHCGLGVVVVVALLLVLVFVCLKNKNKKQWPQNLGVSLFCGLGLPLLRVFHHLSSLDLNDFRSSLDTNHLPFPLQTHLPSPQTNNQRKQQDTVFV